LLEIIPYAVDEVGGPTILATFTVIAALLPMAFVTGLMGPYMSPIPINSSMGMFISLAVAFIVTPWLAARLLAPSSKAGHTAQGVAGGHARSAMDARLDRLFRRLLSPFLDAQKGQAARRKLLVVVLVLILGSVSLAGVKLVVLKMLPFDNKSEFQIVLDMPIGTPLEETAHVLHEIGAEIAQVPEVSNYQTYVGTASPINFNGLVRQYYLRKSPEQGDIQVNLVDKHDRSRKSHEIAVSVREAVERIGRQAGGNAKVIEVPPGPPVLSPIVAEVYGPDYRGQMAVAKEVRKVFEKTPDLVGIDDSVQADTRKAVLHVLQNKAALLGVAQTDIVEVVRMGLAGEDVVPVHNTESKFEIPVRVMLPAEKQGSLEALLKLRVRSREGGMVPISELVEVRESAREKAIYHKDLLPVVYVTGDMGGHIDSPLYGMFDARSKIVGMPLDGLEKGGGTLSDHFLDQPADPYAGYSIKWDGEWKVTYETFRDMGIAYAVGLLLIYLLVVAQFKSYLVPLIIMAPIPLTIIGVMPGHALLGSQYTATSMIGMIALAGIIVRNSILLVDFIRQQVAEGMDFSEAIIQSSAVRAKPIALTGLAAMLGALFILDDPIFNGLAISLIFGIFISTLLTLVVIPVLYFAAFKKEHTL
jgi:multidrug efflux pump subunit AcrB